mgnify:CR=1 FL=1
MICEYNFSEIAQSKIEEFYPKDSNNLFLHKVLNEWAPKLLAKIEDIKSALIKANHPENL